MRRTGLSAGLVVVALALTAGVTGCGGGQASQRRDAGPFAWLQPAAPPTGWRVARTPGGSTLAYPPGWRPIETDPGTASVALLAGAGRFDGYLNATPRQGSETLANWSRFRPDHNRGEGNRGVHVVASANDLGFGRRARGSCVIDSYTTSKATYREIACLVAGPSSSAVVVAAAPASLWKQHAATLERAVSSFVP